MENPVQVLLYFIPAALVLMTCYLLIKQFLGNESKARLIELKKGMQKDILPLRLQAYERVVLFLERISPNNLVLRTNRQGLSARELYSDLLSTVRAEFEHNLSQQIYISASAWEVVRTAKDDVTKIITLAMAQLGEKNSGMDLSRTILEITLKYDAMPTQRAIDAVKKEIRQLYL